MRTYSSIKHESEAQAVAGGRTEYVNC